MHAHLYASHYPSRHCRVRFQAGRAQWNSLSEFTSIETCLFRSSALIHRSEDSGPGIDGRYQVKDAATFALHRFMGTTFINPVGREGRLS